jgi:hypothetical protein
MPLIGVPVPWADRPPHLGRLIAEQALDHFGDRLIDECGFVDRGGGGVGPPRLGVVGSWLRRPFVEPIANETRSPSPESAGASCAPFCRVS